MGHRARFDALPGPLRNTRFGARPRGYPAAVVSTLQTRPPPLRRSVTPLILAGCELDDPRLLGFAADVVPAEGATVALVSSGGPSDRTDDAARLLTGLAVDAVVSVRVDRQRADDVERVRRADAVVLTVTDPLTAVRELRRSPVWSEIVQGLDRGRPLLTVGAATALVGSRAPMGGGRWAPGLGTLARAIVVPGWDPLGGAGTGPMLAAAAPRDRELILIERGAALAGDGENWVVRGGDHVRVRTLRRWRSYAPGEHLVADLRGDAHVRRSA
jgi:hypothetical protein